MFPSAFGLETKVSASLAGGNFFRFHFSGGQKLETPVFPFFWVLETISVSVSGVWFGNIFQRRVGRRVFVYYLRFGEALWDFLHACTKSHVSSSRAGLQPLFPAPPPARNCLHPPPTPPSHPRGLRPAAMTHDSHLDPPRGLVRPCAVVRLLGISLLPAWMHARSLLAENNAFEFNRNAEIPLCWPDWTHEVKLVHACGYLRPTRNLVWRLKSQSGQTREQNRDAPRRFAPR